MDDEEVIGGMVRELREGMRPLEARAEKAFISWLRSSARFEASTGIKWLKPMLDSPRSMFRVGYMLSVAKEANQATNPSRGESLNREAGAEGATRTVSSPDKEVRGSTPKAIKNDES